LDQAFPQVVELCGRHVLLRDEEEPPAPCPVAQARAARPHRGGDREDERADDGRHPPEGAGVQPEERRAPGAREERVETVVAERRARGRAGALPPLGPPADGPPEEVHQDEAAVEDHANGREQAREEDLEEHARREAHRPAVRPRLAPLEGDQDDTERLREEENQADDDQEGKGPVGPPDGPYREEARSVREVVGWGERVAYRLDGAEGEEAEPEERRHVGGRPGQEERAVRAEEPFGEEEAEVLEVPLAPAAVALHLLEEGGRHLLPAAPEVVREPERPAGTPHERRLDEVVAQDLAAERLAPRQTR